MKKLWFRAKWYGWGWYPGAWQGWVAILFYVACLVLIFRQIDRHSHSASDTLIGTVLPVLVLTAALIILAWLTGERPGWRWGGVNVALAAVLERGGVAVIPTDTTYGLVGSAFDERAIYEIYRLRKRDFDKPFIVLIADKRDLKKFGIKPTEAQEKILDNVWPGPTSVILPCLLDKFAYLHRGKNTLAFRVPAKGELRAFLQRVGPLVAPSANPQGHPVARTIAEARAYFGSCVDFYQDGGAATAPPSRLIDITGGIEKVLR